MNNFALITGASSWLWREFAYIHAEHGGDMLLVARREEELQSLKQDIESEYNVKVYIMSIDLTETSSSQKVYEYARKLWSVEVLINNAGFWWVWKFYERKWESDKSMIDLNVVALAELTRLFLPDMLSEKSWNILNVSSTASLLPWPNQAVYYATKAFVTSFSYAVAEELHDTNVTVTALLPGATNTEFGKVSGMNKTKLFKHTASARKVAEDGYRAMLNWQLSVISWLTFSQKILMKLIPLLPKKMILKMIREGQEVDES